MSWDKAGVTIAQGIQGLNYSKVGWENTLQILFIFFSAVEFTMMVFPHKSVIDVHPIWYPRLLKRHA